MGVSVDVRSSGWGPRWAAFWTRIPARDASTVVCGLLSWLRGVWPRDGVAVIIRRAE